MEQCVITVTNRPIQTTVIKSQLSSVAGYPITQGPLCYKCDQQANLD